LVDYQSFRLILNQFLPRIFFDIKYVLLILNI
jgi:hypothetical protein